MEFQVSYVSICVADAISDINYLPQFRQKITA